MEGSQSAPKSKRPEHSSLIGPLVLLCALLLLAFVGVRLVNARLADLAQSRLNNIADQVSFELKSTFARYEDALYGARGLFNGSIQVTRGEWERYAQGQDSARRLHELEALLFVRKVTRDQAASFTAQVRGDTSRDAGGYPQFSITPPGERDTYYVYDFVEPMAGNGPRFGHDAGTVPAEVAAMQAAMESGELRSTGLMPSLSDDSNVVMLYLPVYRTRGVPATVQERKDTLVGYVAAVFNMERVFASVTARYNGQLAGLSATVVDSISGQSTPLVPGAAGVTYTLHSVRDVPFGQDSFQLHIDASSQFGLSTYETRIPIALAAAGAFLSIALFGFLSYQSRTRGRAWELVDMATRELAVQNAKLAKDREELGRGVVEGAVNLNTKIRELEQSKMAMINILEDLTDAKTEIEGARAYDEALLASMADGVIAVDQNARITTANRAVEELFGFTASELIGKDVYGFFKLVSEEGLPVPMESRNIFKAMRASEYSRFNDRAHYYLRKDGSIFPTAIDTSPIILNNQGVGAIQVIRDITREKEIDRAKDEFVSLASHQLRTPLTTVGWYTELVSSPDAGPLTDEQKGYLTEIYAANRRMVDLVDALLNVSRIELGTFIIEPKQTDIVAMVKDALKDLSAFLARKNLHITEHYDAPSISLPSDETLLRMIVQNLVSNAVKYTMENGTVSVSVVRANDRLVLTITDSGIGIPRKDHPDIFKKMFRTDQARLVDPDGTGLGLYLTKSIVDSSGGEISFTSEEKKGSTFTVSYPITGMKARTGNRRLQPASITSQVPE